MSSTSEHMPLLGGNSLPQPGNGHPNEHLPFATRVLETFKAEGEPSWAASYRFFFFGSWLNVLLVFVPLSFISHNLNWDAALRFAFSFIAIMPLAKVSRWLKFEAKKRLLMR